MKTVQEPWMQHARQIGPDMFEVDPRQFNDIPRAAFRGSAAGTSVMIDNPPAGAEFTHPKSRARGVRFARPAFRMKKGL